MGNEDVEDEGAIKEKVNEAPRVAVFSALEPQVAQVGEPKSVAKPVVRPLASRTVTKQVTWSVTRTTSIPLSSPVQVKTEAFVG